MTSISNKGLDLIKEFEGFRSRAYIPVPGDVPTIGYGHTNGVLLGDKCTKAQADEFLENDVVWAEAVVDKHVCVSLDQSQFDALVSFVFNIGESQFSRSTLLRELNKQRYARVDHQLGRWVHSGGVRYAGLVRRRKAEADLFTDYEPSFTPSGAMPQTVMQAQGKTITRTIIESRTAKSGVGLLGLGSFEAFDGIQEATDRLGSLQASWGAFMSDGSIMPMLLVAAGAYIVYLKWSDIKDGRAY